MAGPNNDGRKSDGTFAPGNSLGGSRKGSRHRTTLAVEALLEGEAEGLTRKAIELALQGDGPALRLCLDRIAPMRRDAPIAFDLPPIETAADAVKASSSVLAAVAEGDITPDEGGRVIALLSAHKSMATVGELEERIVALEMKR